MSNLRCFEGSGSRTFDPNGLLNVKLTGCDWAVQSAPAMRDVSVPAFMLNEPEEVEGFFGESIGSSAGVTELTGIFKREACLPAQGDMAVESQEVVCLCFRVKEEPKGERMGGSSPSASAHTPLTALTAAASLAATVQTATLTPSSTSSAVSTESESAAVAHANADVPIEGYLDWCERGTRSRLNGYISSTGTVRTTVMSPADLSHVLLLSSLSVGLSSPSTISTCCDITESSTALSPC